MSGERAGDGHTTSTIVLSIFAGVGAYAGSYAVAGGTRGYLLEPFASLLTRYTPAIVFRYLRNDLGSTLQGVIATGLAVGTVALFVYAALRAADRLDRPLLGAPIGVVATAVVAALLTGTVLPSIGAGIGAGIVVAVGEFAASWSGRPVETSDRRRFLGGLATAVGMAAFGGWIVDRRARSGGVETDPLSQGDGEDGARLENVDQETIDALLAEAEDKSLDVPKIEPLVSQDFFTVDINKLDPAVNVDTWSLSVTGEVETERTYDYEAIREMESEHRFITLRCVSDTVNGKAIDNALWTGVPISNVLDPSNPQEEHVLLHAADGYTVGFSLDELEDGFLAYGMNGKILPKAHGFPVRALVPGNWGETNAKWITKIEVTSELENGYWEKQGWIGTGEVHTVAKFHAAEPLDDGRIELGGHAYAGTRGVSAVEVSIDGGGTWQEAELSEPLPGDDVWRQWRHVYDPPDGEHKVTVRAVETDGTVQTRRNKQDPYPSGASGWASKFIKP